MSLPETASIIEGILSEKVTRLFLFLLSITVFMVLERKAI